MAQKTKSHNPLKKLAAGIQSLHERHQLRSQPSGFGFAFADRVEYLDAARWDAITAGNSVFLKRDVLRVIQDHGPENIEPRYAMIFRDDKPVAALAAQVVTVTGDRLSKEHQDSEEGGKSKLLKRVLGPAARKTQARLTERMLIAGNLLAWGFHGIAFAPDEDPAELWPAVAEALYRIRRAERLTGETNLVMVKDLTALQIGAEALHRFSYRPMETEPNMVLTIDPAWKNYEDYLAALDAKYRRNAKDHVKKLTEAGCTVEPLKDLHANSQRLHELYLAIHKNAAVRLVTLPESYIPELARVAGEDFRCTVVRRGTGICGFVTTFRDGDTAIAYYIGFDRAAAAEGLPIYLRLLHSTVSDAINWGCKRLSLGRTALEPKAALGAKPEPMSVWMRHRVPSLNWMLRGVLGAVPHAEAPERNPFKAAKDTVAKKS